LIQITHIERVLELFNLFICKDRHVVVVVVVVVVVSVAVFQTMAVETNKAQRSAHHIFFYLVYDG
jgi:phage-related holin